MVKGQTILLIHGAGSVGNEWRNFQKSFETLGNKVIAPTLRLHKVGNAVSSDLGQVSIVDYVNDMEEISKVSLDPSQSKLEQFTTNIKTANEIGIINAATFPVI